MNVFHKIAIQGLKKSRTRTIVTIIGVVLSSAMITAVATFGISLLHYVTNGAIHKYGDWHVEVMDVPSAFVEEQKKDESVAEAVCFEEVGYAKLNGGKNPDKPYLFVAGFNDDTYDSLPINLLSGRLPENSSEIVVSGGIAVTGGVKYSIGDTISLKIGNRMSGNKELNQNVPYAHGEEALVTKEEKRYTVVGICQKPGFEDSKMPGYTVITKADCTSEAERFSLFVTLKNAYKVHSYTDSNVKNYPYVLNDNVLRFMGLSDDNVFNMFLYVMIGIVMVIIMIGSLFLIYNAFNISLNERTHQFGLLLSVGATAKQLRNSVLFEGLCIGIMGIPIGMVLGIGSMGFVLSVVAHNFENILYDNVPLTLTISVPVILVAALVSLVTILVSAYIPARIAVNTPVMDCIRQTNEVKMDAGTIKMPRLTQRIFGLEGALAQKNFKRNKKRYRSIVLSLILSVVLFVSTSTFVTYIKQESERSAEYTTYDIGFASKDLNDDDMLSLYEKLTKVDGIYNSSYQAVMSYTCAVDPDELSDACLEYVDSHLGKEKIDLPMKMQFLDDTTYLDIIQSLNLPEEDYFGNSSKLIAVAKMEGDQASDIFTASTKNVCITPESASGTSSEQVVDVNLTFVDVVPPDTLPVLKKTEQTPYFFMVMAPYSFKDRVVTSDEQLDMKGMTFQSKNAKQSVADMESVMEEEGITASYNLYNMCRMLEDNRNLIFIANVFCYTFIIMMSLIAVANVFNTISTNIKLRRRELAMLRSIGMSDHDFQKMMNFECAFYGMRALLFGLPLATLCSWLICKGMFIGDTDNIDFVFPWVSIGISTVSVLFVVFVTMLYSVSKIKKENIIDALRDDMI